MSKTGEFVNYTNEGSTANPNTYYPQPSITVNPTINYPQISITAAQPMITVGEVLARQSRADGWICPDCRYHKGNLNCDKNMFISFVGCYTKDCQAFKDKSKDE
jgi:hypothetical protein